MVFRFYSNAMSQATRSIAAGVFIVGLLLIGFGFMITLLPEFFAYLAAIVFFIAGIGCAASAVKMFISIRKLEDMQQDESVTYRENVHIRTKEYFDE